MLAGCTGGLLARMLPAMMQTQNAGQSNNTAATYLLQPAYLLPAHILPAHILAGQAVALHALTGKSLAEQWPLRGNTPSAVADALPHTLSTYACGFSTSHAASDTTPLAHTQDSKDDILPWPR